MRFRLQPSLAALLVFIMLSLSIFIFPQPIGATTVTLENFDSGDPNVLGAYVSSGATLTRSVSGSPGSNSL